MKALRRLVWAIPWLVLPVEPAWAGGFLALLGVWGLAREGRPRFWGPFLLFALLGSLGQLFSPSELFSLPRPAFLGTPPSGLPPNRILPFDLDGLHGWNPKDGAGGWAERVGDGFWRLPRRNPATGREQAEFLADRWYPLKAGQTYTESFYLRRDGTRASFQITFVTERGHHPVPTRAEPVAPGVWRVWGSYTAQEGDRSVRAIDFLNGGGDWTYLEVGFPQLEVAPAPTPYRPGPVPQAALGQRVLWWWGVALMGWLALQGGGVLLGRSSPRWAAAGLLLGLLVHLGYGLWQLAHLPPGGRAVGLTPQPNFFGHGGVMAAGLAWLLGGSALGGAGLLLGAATVWASGSRAAFLSLLVLLLGWLWGLRRGIRLWALGGVGILALLFWQDSQLLGRLAALFGLDDSGWARLQIWRVAWEAFRQHPLGGVGWGNFSLYYQLHLPAGAIVLDPGHAHDLFLQLAAEGGLPGLLAFASLLTGVGLGLWRRRAYGVLSLLAASLVLGLFDYTWFYAGVHYPLWVAVAWALTTPSKPNSSPPATMRG